MNKNPPPADTRVNVSTKKGDLKAYARMIKPDVQNIYVGPVCTDWKGRQWYGVWIDKESRTK